MAPSDLAAGPSGAGASAAASVAMHFTDNSDEETGFQVQRKVGARRWRTIATLGANPGVGPVDFADPQATAGKPNSYRVRAVKGGLSSAYSNTLTVTP
jgi:hypothetical protein